MSTVLARRLTRLLATAAAGGALFACLSSGAGAVVGGSTIQIQAAPWTVFVQQTSGGSRYLCTGSVVDASHILTAAHCLYDANNNLAPPSAFQVRAGISNFSAPLATDLEQDRAVSQYRVHPGFVSTEQAQPDDVAVLALVSPLDLTGPAVKAVALPPANGAFPAGVAVGLAGFGKQTPTTTSSGPLSWMTGTVDPQGVCSGSPGGLIANNAIEICESSGTSAVCNGDSGGGLVTTGATPTLIGVVSAGEPGCDPGSHSIFTYTGANEILAFVQGNDHPATAPREGTNGIEVQWPRPLVVGDTLTCSPGDWPDAGATFAYSFVDSATNQTLETGPSPKFTIPSADKGATIFCEVAASNSGGTSLDETEATSAVAGPPQVRIVRVGPLTGTRGHGVLLRVSLVSAVGLYGKFSVCISPPAAVAGRLCRSTENAHGDSGIWPFIFNFRVKPKAPLGTSHITISAVAGLSTATASALLRIS